MRFLFEFPTAVRWHNISSVLLTLNYIFFVIGNFLSGNGKYYNLPLKKFWLGMGKQMKFYAYGVFRGEKNPFPVSFEQKFNPLQRFTYFIVMYIAMPLVMISGMTLLFPGDDGKEILGANLTVVKDIIHITAALLLTLFLIIHIYISTVGSGSTSHLRGIISGFVQSEDS